MTTRIQDENYKNWIRKQPCHICGYMPKGTFRRYNAKEDKYVEVEASNAVAHTGDGRHTLRYSDHWVVPLCDFHCDPRSPNCHHREDHAKPAEYRHVLRRAAVEYRKRYIKEVLGIDA